MNKQTKYPSLFEQALAIAINEGKAESSKDADPFKSGIVGENYLLFSKQRKLIKSIPLEKLKRGINTVEDGISCLGKSVMGIVSLAILYAFATPRFSTNSDKVKSIAAANTIAIIAKECGIRNAEGIDNPIFSLNQINGYRIFPENRECNGDETNLITAQSNNAEKYPTFSYNVETGKKTCSHDGSQKELYGCSARRNGKW